MKPNFERNEEQEEALQTAIVNWILSSIVYVILIVVGCIIGGNAALICAMVGGVVCGAWFCIACDFYDSSKPDDR